MNNPIKLAIEHLYLTFKKYKIEDLSKVSCFDFGPNAEELASISQELHNIPIECVLALDMSPEHILSKWKSNKKLHKNQVINLFEHFNCPDYIRSCHPEGVYLDDVDKIRKFLDFLYTKLTPEELAAISFR